MKILVFLVACVAAANALSFDYDYYCAHNFYVYPASSCYHFSCYFPDSWCTTEYYEPLLEVYPDDTCGSESWEETDPLVIITDVENALAAARTAMSQDMTSARDQWLNDLDGIILEYKTNYETYLTQYYAYLTECHDVDYSEELAQKIAEYNSSLDEQRQTALDNFNTVISERLVTLEEYHAEIVEKSSECLNTRLEKIAEYKEEVIQQVYDAVVEYTTLHLNVLEQRRTVYQEALNCLFGADSDVYALVKADVAVQEYYASERWAIEVLARKYAFQMSEQYKQLLNFYTCAYKCYMSNSCLIFNSNTYESQCQSVNSYVEYEVDYCVNEFYMKPFTYNYQFHEYCDLTTCDVNEDQANADAVISNLRQQLSSTISEQETNFADWLSTWEQYHIDYKAEFERIVRERHDWWIGVVTENFLHCDGVITAEAQAEIDALRIELSERLTAACDTYNAELDAKLEEARAEHAENMIEYENAMNDFIDGVQAKYDECAATRTIEIDDYEASLIAQRDEYRAALVESLNSFRDNHVATFQYLLAFYHGEDYMTVPSVADMHDCYVSVVDGKVADVLSQFDDYWATTIPALVLHLTCNYTCAVNASISISYHCGGFYNWSYQLPVVQTYSYHCNDYIVYAY